MSQTYIFTLSTFQCEIGATCPCCYCVPEERNLTVLHSIEEHLYHVARSSVLPELFLVLFDLARRLITNEGSANMRSDFIDGTFRLTRIRHVQKRTSHVQSGWHSERRSDVNLALNMLLLDIPLDVSYFRT